MYEPLRRPLRRRARSLGREPQSGRPTASVASRSTTCVVRRLTRTDCTPPRARHRARAALSLPPSLPRSLPLSHTRLSERRAAQRSTPLCTAPCARPAPRAERLRRAERPLSSACAHARAGRLTESVCVVVAGVPRHSYLRDRLGGGFGGGAVVITCGFVRSLGACLLLELGWLRRPDREVLAVGHARARHVHFLNRHRTELSVVGRGHHGDDPLHR